MEEIILLAKNGGKQPKNEERIVFAHFLEMPVPGPFHNGKTAAEVADQTPSPRMFVTHLPVQFLPVQIWEKKPKVWNDLGLQGFIG